MFGKLKIKNLTRIHEFAFFLTFTLYKKLGKRNSIKKHNEQYNSKLQSQNICWICDCRILMLTILIWVLVTYCLSKRLKKMIFCWLQRKKSEINKDGISIPFT